MNTRALSSKQEKKIAGQLAGKVVVNSGATLFKKGDVSTSRILVDGKTVAKPQTSVSLRKGWFEKIAEEAFSMGKDFGVLAFDFGDGGEIFYAVPARAFQALLAAYEREGQ